MKRHLLLSLTLLALMFASCKNKIDDLQPETPTEQIKGVQITSAEFKNDLLFVNSANFQVKTNEAATFYAADPNITISASGLIQRITSGEVVAIQVTSTATGTKSTLTAVGSSDTNHVLPFSLYHAQNADDGNAQYIQGWETLRKLPVSGETYAIILRHADADNGQDYVFKYPKRVPPANWWKSKDSTIARQLNPAGRARATELGTVLRDLKMPIAKIYSSEFYRAYQTAELMNLGPAIVTDSRLNHPIDTEKTIFLFKGLKELIKEKAVAGEMILVASHQPINEFVPSGILPTFHKVSAFNWTGAYIVKISADKSMTYEGAVSFGMFKYWRDLKLKK
jgi:phosphohistidine phosphatase SixA